MMNKLYFFDLDEINQNKQSGKEYILKNNKSQFDDLGNTNVAQALKKKYFDHSKIVITFNDNQIKSNINYNTNQKRLTNTKNKFFNKHLKYNSKNFDKSSRLMLDKNIKNTQIRNHNDQKSNYQKFSIEENIKNKNIVKY